MNKYGEDNKVVNKFQYGPQIKKKIEVKEKLQHGEHQVARFQQILIVCYTFLAKVFQSRLVAFLCQSTWIGLRPAVNW